ncbi:MAG: PDZ domain-containing protein [Cyanobacteria bacterium SZAS LIN-3]|nr:PDZ domain-containing protein [Cyanobacteria bacterium SZAS LIN-3]
MSDRLDDGKAVKGGAADDLAGFSQCDSVPPVWQHFYHSGFEEVKEKYFDPRALKDFDQYEHKYDDRLCTPADLDLALKRMAESLHNPWTKYVSRAEQEAIADRERLGLVPAGFELAPTGDGKYKIEFIHYGSPAQKSPLREGDIVRSINGTDLSSLSLQQAKALQNARAGEQMQVEAVDAVPQGAPDKVVSLPLAPTPPEQVESRMLDGGVGYVRLPDFKSEGRLGEMLKQISQLNQAQVGGLKGLVLDLRNDPGGDLPVAVTAASLFLPSEKMVVAKQYVRSHDPADVDGVRENDLHVLPADQLTVGGRPVDPQLLETLRRLPMTVLVNGSSASAAEVLTGALKDNHRATVLGTHTFGKAVGYRTAHFAGGGELRIAGMKYLTPSGYDLSGRGVIPDRELPLKPQDTEDEQLKAALKLLLEQH